MHTINRYIRRIVTDHHTVMFIGIMLVIMGFISLSEHLFEDVFGWQFKIAYGYIMLGLFNIMLAIAFIIMGTMNIEAGLSKNENPQALTEKRIKALEEKVSQLEKRGGDR